MINAGQVVSTARLSSGLGSRWPPSADIDAPDDLMSRAAAHKLIGALDDLQLSVAGRALDAGASTGGFTQVLLARGCQGCSQSTSAAVNWQRCSARTLESGSRNEPISATFSSTMSEELRSTWWSPTSLSSH